MYTQISHCVAILHCFYKGALVFPKAGEGIDARAFAAKTAARLRTLFYVCNLRLTANRLQYNAQNYLLSRTTTTPLTVRGGGRGSGCLHKHTTVNQLVGHFLKRTSNVDVIMYRIKIILSYKDAFQQIATSATQNVASSQ